MNARRLRFKSPETAGFTKKKQERGEPSPLEHADENGRYAATRGWVVPFSHPTAELVEKWKHAKKDSINIGFGYYRNLISSKPYYVPGHAAGKSIDRIL